MGRRIILLASVAIWTSCAGSTWYHSSKPESAFEADRRACMMEGEERAANWGVEGNMFVIRDFAEECLRARGWYTADETRQAAQALGDYSVEGTWRLGGAEPEQLGLYNGLVLDLTQTDTGAISGEAGDVGGAREWPVSGMVRGTEVVLSVSRPEAANMLLEGQFQRGGRIQATLSLGDSERTFDVTLSEQF